MAVVKAKPTSPGRRFVVKVVNPELHKGKPHKGLIAKKSKTGGRNNAGRITTRHRGGGHKQHYRVIDFKRNKDGIPAVVGSSRVNMVVTHGKILVGMSNQGYATLCGSTNPIVVIV